MTIRNTQSTLKTTEEKWNRIWKTNYLHPKCPIIHKQKCDKCGYYSYDELRGERCTYDKEKT